MLKLKKIIPLLFVFLMFQNSILAGTWVTQYKENDRVVLTDVDVVSSQEAYACGTNGLILRTTNGTDWSVVPFNTTACLYGISVVGSFLRVWTSAATIRFTEDWGINWTESRIEVSYASAGGGRILFFDQNNGFVAAVDGANQSICRTDNGGATWSERDDGDSLMYRVHGTSASNVWMGGMNGTYFKWDGTNWSTGAITGCPDPIRGVYVIDSNNVWAVVTPTGTNNNIFKTNDGGLNWTPMIVQTSGVADGLGGVWFSDQNKGWVAGWSVYYTNNGGTSWIEEGQADGGAFNDIDFSDANNGWAVGVYYDVGTSNWGSLIQKYSVSTLGVTRATPSSGAQGTTMIVTIEGTNFQGTVGSATAVPSVSFGSGIIVSSVDYVSSTQITANISIDASATLGSRDVTVTNPDGGSGSGASLFYVYDPNANTNTFPGVNPGDRGIIIVHPNHNPWNPNADPNLNIQIRLRPGTTPPERLDVLIFSGPGGNIIYKKNFPLSFSEGHADLTLRKSDFTFLQTGIHVLVALEGANKFATGKLVIMPQ